VREFTLIGEKINYSIPRVGRLLDALDFEAVRKIARTQEAQGAHYVDVNVGPLPPEVMADAARAVDQAVKVPVSLDSTDPARLEAGLRACTPRNNKPAPILNSAIESNSGRVLDLRRIAACRVVLLVSERFDAAALRRNSNAEDMHATARRLHSRALEAGFEPEEIYIDPGTPPIASDLEGMVNVVLEAMGLIHRDSALQDSHILIGVSNLTAGLPRHLRLPLQNAFLTLALDAGVDTVIGDPAKGYRKLDAEDDYLIWFQNVLDASGASRIEKLISSRLYSRSPRKG
jgi:cobalamin-dependent methionine synthase I